MTTPASARYVQLARDVNTVLYDEWDPLALAGVAPRDEYESYVPQLIRLALGDDAREAVAMQLAQVEVRQMSLTLTAPAHRLAIADRIIDLVRASGWSPPP
jgi:hypothetical protein